MGDRRDALLVARGPRPHQVVLRRPGDRRRRLRRRQRRDPRAARRERSRQVDAVLRARRAVPARRWRDHDRRRAGAPALAARRRRARHRDGVPALSPRRDVHRRREHRPRHAAVARPPGRCARSRSGSASSSTSTASTSTRRRTCGSCRSANSNASRSSSSCTAGRGSSSSTSRPPCSRRTSPTACSHRCATWPTRGHGVVLVSHKMQEILDHTDRVTVLRDGRNAGHGSTSGLTRDALNRMVFGDRHVRCGEGDGHPPAPR